jgi:hypothetical protein
MKINQTSARVSAQTAGRLLNRSSISQNPQERWRLPAKVHADADQDQYGQDDSERDLPGPRVRIRLA